MTLEQSVEAMAYAFEQAAKVSGLEKDNTRLQDRVAALENELNDLRTENEKLREMRQRLRVAQQMAWSD